MHPQTQRNTTATISPLLSKVGGEIRQIRRFVISTDTMLSLQMRLVFPAVAKFSAGTGATVDLDDNRDEIVSTCGASRNATGTRVNYGIAQRLGFGKQIFGLRGWGIHLG